MSGELTSALCPRCLALALADDEMEEHGTPSVRVGPWQLISQLGSGGAGVVWRARRERPAREVALKVLRGAFLPGERAVVRLRQEAELIARLRHPGIVTLYEMGESDGCAWLAMELMEGGSLAERIRSARPSAREAVHIMAKVARAVHHAHERGVLHRDLKPHNILLEPDNTAQPRVTDFGLARLADSDSSLTKSGELFGTPAYMAPERARGGSSNSSIATDVYGLGATLYELLTGNPPFTAAAPVELLRRVVEEDPPVPAGPGVDRDLATVCLHALEKTPAHRYPSALAFAEDLERWLRHEPVLARRSGPLRRLGKWCRRRPAAAALVAVLFLTTAAGVWLTVFLSAPSAPPERPLTAEERGERTRELMQTVFRQIRSNDALPALSSLSEVIIEGTGDAARDEVNRIRFEALAKFSPRLERLFFPAEAEGLRAQFSSEGKTMLILTKRRAQVWDVQSGNAQGPEITPSAEIAGGELNSDGSRLVLSLSTGVWSLWDPRGGQFIAEGKGSLRCAPVENALQPAVFSGDRFVSVDAGSVRQFHTVDGSPAGRAITLPHTPVWAVYIPGSPRIGVVAADAHFYMLDQETGEVCGTPVRSCNAGTQAMRFRAPPESTVWLRTGDQEILHIDPPTGRLFTNSNSPAPVCALGWVEEIQRAVMLSVSTDGFNYQESFSMLQTGTLELGAAGVSGDFSVKGEYAAGLAANGCAAFFDAVKSRAVSSRLWSAGTPLGIGLTDDGRAAAVRTALPAVWVWRLRENDGALAVIPSKVDPSRLHFSADSSQIIADAGPSGAWDAATGRVVTPSAKAPVIDPSFSPDKTRVIVLKSMAPRYSVIQIQDAVTQVEAALPLAHSVAVLEGMYSPDGRYIAVRDAQAGVQIWDAATRLPVLGTRQHPAVVDCLTFSPDGKMYCTVWGKTSLRVWETVTGEPVTPLLPHAGTVRAMWSPDGKLVATCSDSDVRVWDLSAPVRDAAGLRAMAGALSARRISAGRDGAALPLTAEELRAAWEKFAQTESGRR